jgi:hypothetical protein
MEKQAELNDQVNFVFDFVLLHFQKRIDVNPKKHKNFFLKQKKKLLVLFTLQ